VPVKALLRRLARRCEIHDRASEAKTARLEVETGVDPGAEVRRWAAPLEHRFDDPDLIDCGREWCRRRRAETWR